MFRWLLKFSSGGPGPVAPALPAPQTRRANQMDSTVLRAVQQPLKDAYRENPQEAVVTLRAQGRLGDEAISCSGAMLLQALVACAGVTLQAVATSLRIPVAGGTVRAEGDLDFRGTLAVSKDAPVGFRSIRLAFELDTGANAKQVETLIKLTERYCVVYQTLSHPAEMAISVSQAAQA